MANISTSLADWSSTASSNQPDSTDTNTIQADLQAIQAAVKTAFPNVTGAVTPTHTELNYVDGVTSAIQTQLDTLTTNVGNKAAKGANGDITSLTACTNITALAVTVATDDKVVIQDTSDSDKLKTVTTQAIADLAAPSYLSEAEYITGTETAKALNAAVARAQNVIQGTAVASTSGTSIDFTGLPSWVKRITVMLSGVSTNGTSPLLIQLGDSGGIETTGYLGASSNIASSVSTANFTTGFGIGQDNAATQVKHGCVDISSFGSNIWCASGVVGSSDAARTSATGGVKTLSATLDRVRITTVNGTDAFDAGSINILYE